MAEREVYYVARTYIEYQAWRVQASNLREKIKSTDPIKDYLEILEQKSKLTPLWKTTYLPEKEQWQMLNEKMKKLAFIFDKDPLLQHIAKEKGIYETVKKRSFEVQENITQQHSPEEGPSIERE